LVVTNDVVLNLRPWHVQIVEASPHDFFWGAGFDGSGANQLGRLLMQLRAELMQAPVQDAARQNGTASQAISGSAANQRRAMAASRAVAAPWQGLNWPAPAAHVSHGFAARQNHM